MKLLEGRLSVYRYMALVAVLVALVLFSVRNPFQSLPFQSVTLSAKTVASSVDQTNATEVNEPMLDQTLPLDDELDQKLLLLQQDPNFPHPGAIQQLISRRNTYQSYYNTTDRWELRGLGYLFHSLHWLLVGERLASNKIVIRDVLQVAPTIECDKLTLWVRVAGPEVFAGQARAVLPQNKNEQESCYWEFDFDLRAPGEYEIESKVLLWNGNVPIVEHSLRQSQSNPALDGIQCETHQGGPSSSLSEKYSSHAGFHGFKMYTPVTMCCEACSRYPSCQYWATPPDQFEASFTRNGCEFYFDESQPPLPKSIWLLKPAQRRLAGTTPAFHGPPHAHSAAYFLGCGWSYWFTLDVPCLSGDLDDRLYIESPTFTHEEPASPTTMARKQDLPLCDESHEGVGSSGRWVRRPIPDYCPQNFVADRDYQTKFEIVEFLPDQPECWHRDDLSRVGNRCIEMNCRFIPQSSKWLSKIHNETNWYGVWRNDDCDYVEFTDSELQQCVNERNITSIKTEGRSIAAFLNEYLAQRLKNINLTETGTTVTLSTSRLLHVAAIPDARLREALAAAANPSRGPNEEVYYVSGYFLSSERAVHVHLKRMEYLNRVASEVLADSGKKLFMNVFDLSAAFTYDSATQMDGMHIIGPPMKMAITKFFHHVCKDVVSGRRVGASYL